MMKALKAVLRRLVNAVGLPQLILPRLVKETRRALKNDGERESARLKTHLESLLARHARQSDKTVTAGQRKVDGRIRSHEARIDTLERQLEAQERQLARLEELVNRDEDLCPEERGRLDLERIGEHIKRRFEAASISTEPFAHMIVDDLLPADFYDLLVEAIPPKSFFAREKHSKQDFRLNAPQAPRRTKEVWGFMNREVCARVLMPAFLERFAPMLEAHLGALFGEAALDEARRLPTTTFDGRIMRRRPGYRLGPHQDPMRYFLTALLYLPASGSDESPWGTQLFASDQEYTVPVRNIYYAEADGIRCTLAKTAPYRPNSLLVFLNNRSLHGAEIRPEEAPADLERIAFQFYIGPEIDALRSLIDSLPSERRDLWRTRREKALAVAE